jgi:hypothetical protein
VTGQRWSGPPLGIDLRFLTAGERLAAVIPTSPLPDFAVPADDAPLIARGARFWWVNFALCLDSFATFAVLYCVQPPAHLRAT